MLVSKIWVVLLTVAAVAGLAIARLVPNPAAREIAKTYADNLDRGQHNAELILRLEARDWIDAVAKMSWDGGVVDLLEQASNRRGDLKSHAEKLRGRLLELVGLTRAEPRPQLIIAVDHRGKQIARIGPGEERFSPGEDGLAGYPLVEAALRGYRTDDTWSLDGKLMMMAASPVISRSRGRYVGALLVGLEINDGFAQRLKLRLAGTDLCFFLRGKLVGSTARPEGLGRLPEVFAKRTDEIAEHGRSAVIRLGNGSQAQTAILAGLPGEAGAHGAFYAAIGAPVPAVGLGEMLGLLTAGDVRWSEFPWPLLLGVLVIAVAVGLALLRWEHDAPMRRLLDSARRLGSGEATRLDEYGPGAFSRLARAMNEANEKLIRRGAPAREARPAPAATEARPRVDLGVPVAATGNTLDSPGVQPLGSISADLDAVSPPMALLDPAADGFAERAEGEVPSRRERAALSLAGPGDLTPEPSPRGLAAEPVEIPALSLTITASRPTGTALPAVPTPAGIAASAFDLEPGLEPSPGLGGAPRTTAASLRAIQLPDPDEEAIAKPLRAPEPGPSLRPPVPPPAETRASRPTPRTTTAARLPPADERFDAPELTPVVSIDPEQEYYRHVFDDFLAVKRQCGESTSALTFERFVEKLRKNRDSLIKSYGCKAVKFQVYIKDGKAALKATPVKD